MYNSKCGRINQFDIELRPYGNAIYLDAHPVAVDHLRRLLDASHTSFSRPGRQWTDVFVIDGPLPAWTAETLELLSEIVVMEPPSPIASAIAVDWYTTPPTAEDDEFHQTPIGDRILWSKRKADLLDPPMIEKLQREVAADMARTIRRHVEYRRATALVTSPPHILANHGYAVQLAELISAESGLPLVRTAGKTPVRKRRKDGETVDLEEEFTVDPHRVAGQTVIVVDDVYKQGDTMRGVAFACRRAHAAKILGLAAARTLSNN
jgi:adenine/guanine phosphoribosyltransferase-like PRPP-binding protein